MLNNEILEFEVSVESWEILRKVNFALELIEKQENKTDAQKLLKRQFEEIKESAERLQGIVPDWRLK